MQKLSGGDILPADGSGSGLSQNSRESRIQDPYHRISLVAKDACLIEFKTDKLSRE